MEISSKYDSLDSVKARKEQEDPWVMYLIVNDALNMSAGKIAAQAGHAVGKLYESYEAFELQRKLAPEIGDSIELCNAFNSWKNDSFRKVVLKAKESKWEKLKEQLTCVVIRDAGLTEIDPGSETVIGVFPMRKSQRPNILRKLQTLK